MIRAGLDVLLGEARRLAGRRYALLAHAASVTAELDPIVPALAAAGAPLPRFLLAPEHGFHAVEQDMVPAEAGVEPWSGRPVRSLYGREEGSLRPAPEAFDGVDLLLVDLQDVGSRFYTFAATAVWAARAAVEAGCEAWILDRPNPLGGVAVEGNRRRPGLDSFVGAFDHPVRHGLTLGELARLEATRGGWVEGLRVIAIEGWRREWAWEACGLPWVPPSPNMPTVDTARVYPGACLVEGTTLSEGRGTTQPFLLAGAPGLDAPALTARLAAARLPGVRFQPALFRPQFQKHAGEVCAGVRWVVVEPDSFRPFRTGVEVLRAVRELFGERLAWRREAYEFVADRPAIDLLAGDVVLREALDGGDFARLDDWIATWPAAERAFRVERREILLYPEPDGGGPA